MPGKPSAQTALFVDATERSGISAGPLPCTLDDERQYFVTGQAWIGCLVGVLAAGYADLEARVAARRGLLSLSKQEQVRRYVLEHAPRIFRAGDVRLALPGISQATVGLVLAAMKDEGLVEPLPGSDRGRSAAWQRR